jgi:hypothetical protein
LLPALRINIDERQPLPVSGPLVADINPDVVIFRDIPPEVPAHVVIGTAAEHGFLLQKRFNIVITPTFIKTPQYPACMIFEVVSKTRITPKDKAPVSWKRGIHFSM